MACRARPRRHGLRRQHPHPLARGAAPGHGGGRPAALRARRRARHHRPVRLRRHPGGRLRRPHQARPGHGGTARHRLLLGLGPRAARRDRRRRPGEPRHRHPRPRRADDARLRAHQPVRCPAGPAGHVQHGRGGGRPRAAVHLEPGPSGAGRPAAARGRRPGRYPLDRDRSVLHLPHAQRLRRRRPGRARRVPVRGLLRRVGLGRPGPADAGPVDDRPCRRDRNRAAASTTAPRSSRASIPGSSDGRTATATAR